MEEKLYTSPAWPDSVDWLSRHKGKWAVMACTRCRYRTPYDVDETLKAQETDVALSSLPGIIARHIGCKLAVGQHYDPCGMRTEKFIDPPKPPPPRPPHLPRDMEELPDMRVKDIPISRAIYVYCPCGRGRCIDLRYIVPGLPSETMVSDILPRMVCTRCRNTKGHVAGYRDMWR